MKSKKKSGIIYESFIEYVEKTLKDNQDDALDLLYLLLAYTRYVCDNAEQGDIYLDKIQKSYIKNVFEIYLTTIENNIKRYYNGQKGGRPLNYINTIKNVLNNFSEEWMDDEFINVLNNFFIYLKEHNLVKTNKKNVEKCVETIVQNASSPEKAIKTIELNMQNSKEDFNFDFNILEKYEMEESV